MKDYIFIDNLEIFANHGVLREENSLGQKFLVSAKLYVDVHSPAIDDDLNKSVNYAEVCEFICGFMKNNTFKLIETVAYRLAVGILVKFPLCRGTEITVKKPWAPIGVSVENIFVTCSLKWHRAFIALGSNIGDSKAHIEFALNELGDDSGIRVVKQSDMIVTKPYGGVQQDDFLNGVVEISTIYSPNELLDICMNIEKKRDRRRDIHWGPRTLDLDILFYDDEIIDTDNLIIPHPDMANRDFVLVPMSQIAPHFIHPVSRMTMVQMKEQKGF